MSVHRIIIAFLGLSLIFGSIYLGDAADTSVAQTLAVVTDLPIIVIDPGHGGIDSGTSGGDGTLEKEINLSISQKLNCILTAMGFETILTREKDELIGEGNPNTIRSQKRADIQKRLALVESIENVVLISVHQNYYQQSKYDGFQSFFTTNNPENKLLAQAMQETVVSFLQPDNTRKIKPIGSEIYLLHHCTKPAVMIECGFMSNAKELSLLKNEKYQAKMAFAIGSGLVKYLNEKS